MAVFTSKTEYLDGFQKKFTDSNRENGALASYVEKQLTLLDQLVAGISPETFWALTPDILGIDAKLVLLTEMIRFDDFSDDEIIRIVEKDYHFYLKELCGYNLGTKGPHSLVFNVR
ncbi:DUF7006 family protein [Enterococcus innesii]|uniref:DUF7006 family protein n=1 Tax=Enterococcus innesii TaxID=2839759 RepID=UPI002DBD5529|nr:hypothetical protein [Enterococcus innesii]MEB5953192.1 hypothetical protein [Enterococcus innesii]